MERKNAELILMADDRGNLHRFHRMIVIASPEPIRKIIEDEFLRVGKDPETFYDRPLDRGNLSLICSGIYEKNGIMTIRMKAESRACLLDSTQPGSLVHDVLAGAPVISRAGDPPGGLYEVDCSDTDCRELMIVAAKHCPDALLEIEAEMKRHNRS